MRRSGTALAALALVALAPDPGRAVVGGAPDDGALSRATVMVLSSKGGVCSGVLVAPDTIVTAAHCVAGAAEHRVHYKGADGAPVLIEVAAKAIHPGYAADAIKTRRPSVDLALVRAAEPLPARFAPTSVSDENPAPGAGLILGGYGAAREGDPRSTGTFRIASLTGVAPYGPSRILVWAKGDGAGACQGDSGGPIAGATGILAVATWATGAKSRGCGELTQGVLLGPQRDWIDRTLAGWGRAARWS
jgi:hypothetical protein